MTGTVHTQNPAYSRLTFALLEDSGWYLPNYELVYNFNKRCNVFRLTNIIVVVFAAAAAAVAVMIAAAAAVATTIVVVGGDAAAAVIFNSTCFLLHFRG